MDFNDPNYIPDPASITNQLENLDPTALSGRPDLVDLVSYGWDNFKYNGFDDLNNDIMDFDNDSTL
ncbi:hypothetical protein CQA49_08180 [Helicobacter sp. MIT 00-7814]|uniref:hypothetical protein n=1 Tax=unclassified Helicobacter TaxID=2593540 RepID=UPI000E1F00D5|nr:MULTISPECIES: hypothetical protein [unclassified Helicobacter]RDU51592.1 hypothetical protein CQA37_09545 [Helicobacter sp. MIT 99-10781]RDU52528.1 hypothetical protein CQA49_08180 [Helicobacter sp. MIT 00-7814]